MEIRTEADLLSLVGESESIVLEFKGPEDFLLWPQGKQNVTKSLSKEVSALANTYGGKIIIGLKETRENPRRVESLQGIDPRDPAIETIQRLIESNIRPRLEGIRYQVIPLTGGNEGRVAYVISVPQGRTAYQASDKLYYGRSEYESVPLEDQLIRYKMVRERLAEATINVVNVAIETAQDEYQKRQKELKLRSEDIENDKALVYIPRKVREGLEAPPRKFDDYSLSISIRNTGAITIRDCLLEAEIISPRGPTVTGTHFRLAAANTVRTREEFGSQITLATEAKLFPNQEELFPGATLRFGLPANTDVEDLVLNWKLYLDDSPPIAGKIELGEHLKRAVKG